MVSSYSSKPWNFTSTILFPRKIVVYTNPPETVEGFDIYYQFHLIISPLHSQCNAQPQGSHTTRMSC